MSPRPYQLGQRKAASDQTRARILAAARALLMAPDGYSRFSIETVARQADVARMTVYHQFGSKAGLLEGLCDSLAVSGGMEQLAGAFQLPDPLAALNRYTEVFGHFWEVDRLVMRKLRALAALDPDFEQVIRSRDEWRRRGVRTLLQRMVEQQLLSFDESSQTFAEVVEILVTLTSFETFDTLAGSSHTLEEVAPVIQRLVRAAIGLVE